MAVLSLTEQLKIHFHNPHALLGIHPIRDHRNVIRLWRPNAKELYVEVRKEIREATRIDDSGIFEIEVEGAIGPLDYRIYHHSGLLAHDPYAFWPVIGGMDEFLFNKGTHYKIYEVLGSHVMEHQGCSGTRFAVWAPGAKQVALVGDFNHWDGRVNPMRSMGSSGIWELFVPGIGSKEKYKFEIRSSEGSLSIKTDPFANQFELRPSTAAVVSDLNQYSWGDQAWIANRKKIQADPFPMNIYEVHLGSWRRRNGEFMNYRELACDLGAYCLHMGFTHIELLPIEEHPLDESWGYQVTGFFAPTSRYGDLQEFQYFVDQLHQQNIGVILDWVPAHFPADSFSLARFDGTYLYEHADPKKGYHPHWSTLIFNYGRNEVSNVLIGSALFWLEAMHIDGLRVDAVASMLYLDYGREHGQWIPNIYGGNENLEAIEFLKHLNAIVHERVPGVLICAEESSAFTGVTHSLDAGGLGFDFKWNMGWMNDTLRYFHTDPFFRHYHHHMLTFGRMYAFSERFILPLSHDEVVHGKRSLLSKMPGDEWQRFANLRLLLSYQICQPGKKLLFMGDEMGVYEEWSVHQALPWKILSYPMHEGVHRMVKELNHFYLKHKELWEFDLDERGFSWVDFSDQYNSVISYLRKGSSGYLLCIHNFTPSCFPQYALKLSHVHRVQEVFNTDRTEYGGSGKLNPHLQAGLGEGIVFQLAPLATMIFSIEFGH
ncbi:MAG: 1,4-alpha-glucan branching protein GlgB [Simkania sp.]|nr:1,4-alpha-glucan branching protein GlgB [Simkania sp.]